MISKNNNAILFYDMGAVTIRYTRDRSGVLKLAGRFEDMRQYHHAQIPLSLGN